MMILSTSPASPFGRKVRMAAHVVGLAEQITLESAAPGDPTAIVQSRNPLAKVPVLGLEDGTVLYDSRVILEYLDHRAGGGVIVPAAPAKRFAALRLQALADGILDASVLIVYESRHRPPERRHQGWIDRQSDKVTRAVAELETAPPTIEPVPDVGQIAMACALGYRDFRFEGGWRGDHPGLVAWLDEFAERVPSYRATAPVA